MSANYTTNTLLQQHGQHLLDAGYEIVPIVAGLKHPNCPNWQRMKPDVEQWASEEKYTGAGVKTKRTPAVDVDIRNKAINKKMVKFTQALLGNTVIRIGDAPKSLLFYRTDTPFKKLTSNLYESKDGDEHRIEILANGQQAVAYHIHPDTEQPYYYPESELTDVPVSDLPTITAEQAVEIIEYFESIVPKSWTCISPGSGRGQLNTKKGTAENLPEWTALSGEDKDEELGKMLTVLVGDHCDDRDSWKDIVAACKRSGAPNAKTICRQWSETSKEKFDEVSFSSVWSSYGEASAGDIMIGTLIHAAKQEGYMEPWNPDNWEALAKASEGLPTEMSEFFTSTLAPIDHTDDELDIMEVFSHLIVTAEDVAKIGKERYVIKGLIIQGHICIIVGEPGSGKTALIAGLAPEMIRNGYKVLYFNLDCGGVELKRHQIEAEQAGYVVISPDLKQSSPDEVVKLLKKMAGSKTDLSDTVVVMDTLKKFVDLMSKSDVKNLMATLRMLTTRGCTIIPLGHCNKGRDKDGNLIYEGVGDVKNDTDELQFLEYNKQCDGQTITTYHDPQYGGKTRGEIEQQSFHLDLDTRKLTRLDEVVDTRQGSQEVRAVHKVDPLDEIKTLILDAIDEGGGEETQTAIVEYCTERGVSQNKVREALNLACSGNNPKNYLARKRGEKNSWIYRQHKKQPFWL